MDTSLFFCLRFVVPNDQQLLGTPRNAEIPLKKGAAFTLVDAVDERRVRAHSWHCRAGARPYVQSSIKVGDRWVSTLLHRFVLGAPKGLLVDHRNGDVLDNRRSNLRLATPAQNAAHRTRANTGRFIGVYPTPHGWVAMVNPRGKSIYLGTHESEEVAADAYNQAAQICFGEFAGRNEVPHIPGLIAHIKGLQGAING